MHKQIIVTDLTRMRGFEVCIAGIEIEAPHCCIRPQLAPASGCRTRHPDEQWLHSATGGPVRPFSLISLDVFENFPNPPHTEDWRVDLVPARVQRVLGEADRRALLESIQQPSIDGLFGASVMWNQEPDGMRSAGRVEPQSGTASLGTLRVRLHDVVATAKFDGSIKYYAGFSDAAGTWNQAKITDLSFIFWAGSLSKPQDSSAADLTRSLRSVFRAPNLEVWLRIGLARPFAPRDAQKPMCFVQVTGVYTFPDYLDGAAWCDFDRPRA